MIGSPYIQRLIVAGIVGMRAAAGEGQSDLEEEEDEETADG